MILEDFIPNPKSFIPVVGERELYKALIKNPNKRDLEVYKDNFENLKKDTKKVTEYKGLLRGFIFTGMALSNPLGAIVAYAGMSYVFSVMTNYFNNSKQDSQNQAKQ